MSGDDLRLRFGRSTTTHALAAYVAALDFTKTLTFAAKTADDAIVAVVEAFPHEAGGHRRLEVAFSTDADRRRCGLATRLFREAAAAASNLGVRQIVAQCDLRNRAMRSVMQGTGAVLAADDGEVLAHWNLDVA